MEDVKLNNYLHTLIPLDEIKLIMGVDGREDKTARFGYCPE